jgi:hypothetical protein
VNAAAAELGTTWPPLRKAFTRHGLGMPARNPEAIRQRAVARASRRASPPAAPTLDPVFVALNPGQLPAPRGSRAEQGVRLRRAKEIETLSYAPWSNSTARAGSHPSGGWPPSPAAPNAPTPWPATGSAAPSAAMPTASSAATAATPTVPTAPADPTNPKREGSLLMPDDQTRSNQRDGERPFAPT